MGLILRTITLAALWTAVLCMAPARVSAQGTPATPKREVEALIDEDLPFAARMLREHGEFFPFGVVMTADGEIRHVGADPGSEQPPSQDVINLLLEQFRESAKDGQYRAVAFFADVRVQAPGTGEKINAVQVGLEHKRGYCVDVYFPYSLPPDSIGSEVFASRRKGTVFGTCE